MRLPFNWAWDTGTCKHLPYLLRPEWDVGLKGQSYAVNVRIRE